MQLDAASKPGKLPDFLSIPCCPSHLARMRCWLTEQWRFGLSLSPFLSALCRGCWSEQRAVEPERPFSGANQAMFSFIQEGGVGPDTTPPQQRQSDVLSCVLAEGQTAVVTKSREAPRERLPLISLGPGLAAMRNQSQGRVKGHCPQPPLTIKKMMPSEISLRPLYAPI